MSFALADRGQAILNRARSLDRALIIIGAILLASGLILAMAASPAATARIRVDEAFHFALRQVAYAALGLVLAALAAQLDARAVRRTGVIIAAIALPLCALAAFAGPDIKGAARWLVVGDFSFQPSEVLKPGLVVLWAWMLAETHRRESFPGRAVCLATFALAAAFLLAQPDIGQTALLAATLAVMLALRGHFWRWIAGFAGLVPLCGFLVYEAYPHARERIDAYLDRDGEGAYQVSRALEAIASGGVFGRGPGEGVVKRALPDAQADFVYAVGAEEFGLLASVGLIALYGALAFRGLSRASRLVDPFAQLAVAGLVTLLVVQAAIHIAVNLGLAPAKGMTAPFVSFGGSSMLGAALAFGFILALTRYRPGAYIPAAAARLS